MKNSLVDILGDALAPELIASLQEAFDQKVAEAKEEAEHNLREEFAQRSEHRMAQMVEAMDRMLTDAIRVNEEAKATEIKKLSEARAKYRNAVVENRKAIRASIVEAAKAQHDVVSGHLMSEIKSLRENKAALAGKAQKLAEDVEGAKAALKEQHAKHLAKINEFVVRQISKELTEFHQDKRALVETRVKLVRESKAKLAEAQARFVKESAAKVEQVVTATLGREMTQLYEELERNRQNMFGRRIFEAVAAEFMTSYLAEGTEIRKLQKVLESKDAALAKRDEEVASAKAALAESAKASEIAARKARLAEGTAARTKIMSELLANLKGEKRAVMESMLETYKTDALRPAFNKLLPVVLSEGTRKAPLPAGKTVLSEKAVERRAPVAVTGNKANRLLEAAQAENAENDEIAEIMHLAGIRK